MTQFQLQYDISVWLVEGTFIAGLILSVVYIPFFKWKETITGRATATLGPAISGVLLHSVLMLWGVVRATISPKTGQLLLLGFWNQFLTWLSVGCLFAAGLAIAALALVSLRCLIPEGESSNRFVNHILHFGKKINV